MDGQEKHKLFFHKKQKHTKTAKGSNTIRNTSVWYCGVLLGSTAGVPFWGGTVGALLGSTAGVPFFCTVGVLLVSTAGVPFFLGAVGLLLGRTAGVPLFGTVGVLWGVLQEYNFWYWFCVMASLLLVLLVCTGPSTGLVLCCVLDHSTTLNNQQILL